MSAAGAVEIRVLTYNILTGGRNFGQPLSQTVALIRAAEADIVGLQEQGGATAEIADALGFAYHIDSNDLSFLSRFPIRETLAAVESVGRRLSSQGMES